MPSRRVAVDLNAGTYYLTLTIQRWYYLFDRYNRWQILAESLRYCQENKGLELNGYVFMLNHIHLITTSSDMAGFLRDFKRFTSVKFKSNLETTEPSVLKLFVDDKGKYRFWMDTNAPKKRSRVDGELIRVAFKEGQMVHAGELLAEIDPRAFQVQLMQAEGQLLRDAALLKNAETDLVRYKTLLEQDSIAAQQAVTQESLVKQYKGTVAMDRGLVANAKLQLSYARITAPITGRLGLRLVDQGNIVHASDANGLAVITQIQPIAVVFTLPEDNLEAVMKQFHSGKSLPIEVYDRSGESKLAQGQLLAVDNQIDTNTGTVKFKGQFANEDNALFSNQFVNIKMKMETLRSVTIIPTAAIQRGIIGTFVYVVKADQTVSVRPLTLGPAESEKTAVLEGLQPDERVVVDGADKLRENMKVKLITRERAPASDEAPSPQQSPSGQGSK